MKLAEKNNLVYFRKSFKLSISDFLLIPQISDSFFFFFFTFDNVFFFTELV